MEVPARSSGVAASFKDRARARHGWPLRCAYCGWSVPDVLDGDAAIHAHHIVPLACFGSDDDSNQILLCPNHHALAHRIGRMPGERGQRRWIGARTPAQLLAELYLIEHDPRAWRDGRHLR